MTPMCSWHCSYFWAILALFGVTGHGMKAGPFDVVFDHAEECFDIGSGDMRVSLKIKRLTRLTVAIDVNLTVKVPLDDDNMASLKLAQFTNGGYKSNFYTIDVPKACNTITKLLPVMQKEIFKASKMGKCPVKLGTYILQNFTSKERINTVPVFFYGKYKGEVVFSRFSRRIGCMELYATIIPKRPGSTHKKIN